MKHTLLLALLALFAIAQTTPPAPTPALTQSAPAKLYVNVRAIRAKDGTYSIHPTMKLVKALCVYRNGIRQEPVYDYTYVAATGIIFPKTPWSESDIILLDFHI